jgi:hypothetical protein
MWTYILQDGETLLELAARFHTRVTALEAANPGIGFIPVKPGQPIHIPGCPTRQQTTAAADAERAALGGNFNTAASSTRARGQNTTVPFTTDGSRWAREGHITEGRGEDSRGAESSESDTLRVPALDPKTNLLYVPITWPEATTVGAQTSKNAAARKGVTHEIDQEVVFIRCYSGGQRRL